MQTEKKLFLYLFSTTGLEEYSRENESENPFVVVAGDEDEALDVASNNPDLPYLKAETKPVFIRFMCDASDGHDDGEIIFYKPPQY